MLLPLFKTVRSSSYTFLRKKKKKTMTKNIPDSDIKCTANSTMHFSAEFNGTDRGGGQKTKWKTPSPNFEELIESITNMLLFFAGGSRKKSYEVSKFGGGGGGGVYALNEFFEKNS